MEQRFWNTGELPTAESRLASWFFHRCRNGNRYRAYMVSTGVTSRRSAGSLMQNVDGCINVPVVCASAVGAAPAPISQLQRSVANTTSGTQLCRRKEPVHMYDIAAIPVPFVCQLPHEFRPTRILDRHCQRMILQHTGHVQIFQPDHLVLVDQAFAEFMLEIHPLIGDAFIQTGQAQTSFLPVGAAFLFAGMLPVQTVSSF